MTVYHFTLHLPPTAKGRPRFAIRGKGDKAFVQTYTPDKTVSFEASVAHAARAALGPLILSGPLRVDILAVFPRTKELDKVKVRVASAPPGPIWKVTRPDGDNVRKAVLDGMKACWHDDSQVVCGDTVKVYAEKNGRPRTVVRVEVLDESAPMDWLLGWIARA